MYYFARVTGSGCFLALAFLLLSSLHSHGQCPSSVLNVPSWTLHVTASEVGSGSYQDHFGIPNVFSLQESADLTYQFTANPNSEVWTVSLTAASASLNWTHEDPLDPTTLETETGTGTLANQPAPSSQLFGFNIFTFPGYQGNLICGLSPGNVQAWVNAVFTEEGRSEQLKDYVNDLFFQFDTAVLPLSSSGFSTLTFSGTTGACVEPNPFTPSSCPFPINITGTLNWTLTAGSPLSITTPSLLPDGAKGIPYPLPSGGGVNLQATGGVPPYSWNIESSLFSVFPPGLSLSTSDNVGVISGATNRK